MNISLKEAEVPAPVDIIRTSPADMVFSPSALASYLECPRKFYIKYILKAGATEKALPLFFGSVFHEAVATFYRTRNEDHEKAVAETLRVFTELWGEVPGDKQRNLGSGQQLLRKYCENYKKDMQFDPVLVEVQQTVDLSSVLNYPATLAGRLDRVQVHKDIVFFVDTKTSKNSATDFYFRQFENGFELSCYQYICTQLFGHCDYAQIDAVKTDGTDFTRRVVTRKESQMKEFLNTLCEILDIIHREVRAVGNKPDHIPASKFHMNQTACVMCPYLSFCAGNCNIDGLQMEE